MSQKPVDVPLVREKFPALCPVSYLHTQPFSNRSTTDSPSSAGLLKKILFASLFLFLSCQRRRPKTSAACPRRGALLKLQASIHLPLEAQWHPPSSKSPPECPCASLFPLGLDRVTRISVCSTPCSLLHRLGRPLIMLSLVQGPSSPTLLGSSSIRLETWPCKYQFSPRGAPVESFFRFQQTTICPLPFTEYALRAWCLFLDYLTQGTPVFPPWSCLRVC